VREVLRKIEITEDDIRFGKESCRKTCMVARAVSRVLPQGWRVEVGWANILLIPDNGCVQRCKVPSHVRTRIEKFDYGYAKPFNFYLAFVLPSGVRSVRRPA
jgi:hypothetical protein